MGVSMDKISTPFSNSSTRGGILLGLAVWLFLPAYAAEGQTTPRSTLRKIRVASDGRTFETQDGKPFVPIGVKKVES